MKVMVNRYEFENEKKKLWNQQRAIAFNFRTPG
jgi:hypothetical protein